MSGAGTAHRRRDCPHLSPFRTYPASRPADRTRQDRHGHRRRDYPADYPNRRPSGGVSGAGTGHRRGEIGRKPERGRGRSDAANGCACHRPADRERLRRTYPANLSPSGGRPCAPVRRHRAQADGERLHGRQAGNGTRELLPNWEKSEPQTGGRRTVAPVTCPAARSGTVADCPANLSGEIGRNGGRLRRVSGEPVTVRR